MKFGWKLLLSAVLFAVLAAGGYWGYRRWQGRASVPEPTVAGVERKVLYYVDPMHPSYKSDKPGVAPDCGMKLVPVYADDVRDGAAAPVAPVAARTPEAASYAPVQISPAQQHLIGVTTGRAEYRTLDKTIRTVGRVDVDETRITRLHTRISGWVEEVFVDYTFQHVVKGDPLFSIYSPDLVASQEELLLALKAQQSLGNSGFPNVSSGANSLLDAARRRLSLWDVSAEQIEQIERTGQIKRNLVIYSPTTGHVTQRNIYPKAYVTPETELYTIVDHSHVWMYADIYESEMGLVRLRQQATATTEAYPGRVFRGQVSYIWPHLEKETRTLKVRLDFPNPDLALKPEMYANVELKIPLGRRLVVPESAVIDTGARQLVFVVQAPGSFVPRDVRTGVRADGYTEILQGLKPAEPVVTSANFLIDSESQLRAALGAMTLGSGVTEIGGQGAPATPAGGAGLRIQFRTDPTPPRTGRNNITVSVTDGSGKPVSNAQVKVVFFMPAMPAMGMAAMRSEAALAAAAGTYRGEITLASSGSWQVTVTVERGGTVLQTEQLTVTAQ